MFVYLGSNKEINSFVFKEEMKSSDHKFLIALRLGSKNDASYFLWFIKRDPDGGITSMCHTNHRREEKKVVIRYLLQTSFPLSRGWGAFTILLFSILIFADPFLPSQTNRPLPFSAPCQIIQVCTEGDGRAIGHEPLLNYLT